MVNFTQYLFTNVYSSFVPLLNTASAVCSGNGRVFSCGQVDMLPGAFIGALISFYLFFFLILILMIVSNWKIYKKAGQPGWSSIIPIYNMVVLLHIIKKPVWWVILMFIPVVNIVLGVMVCYNEAKVFGKGIGFTLGLLILPFIFYPILAFGESKYLLPISPLDQGIGASSESQKSSSSTV